MYKTPENMLIIKTQIDILLQAIQKYEEVAKVILFGSCARDNETEANDIDILILVKDDTINGNNLAIQIRQDTFRTMEMPVDLLVETIASFDERKTLPTLERVIHREGVVLYAA